MSDRHQKRLTESNLFSIIELYMATVISTKKQTKKQMIQTLIQEVKRLQFQAWLLSLPEEDLEGYAHPEQIEQSYRRAIKEHPPKI